VTDEVKGLADDWRSRPLEPLHPTAFFDALRVNIWDEGHVVKKATYIALAIRPDGRKEVFGMWAERNGGSKFWLRILNELKNRGIGDIPIAAAGGLARFPEALSAVFLKTEVQLRIAAHGPQFGEAHAAQGSQGGGPRGNMPCPLLGRCGGGHAAVRRKAGREIPGNLKIMAGLLERGRTAHEVIAGNPQGHIHGQRCRVAELHAAAEPEDAAAFPRR